MSDWHEDWWKQLEQSTVTLENFFQDINKAVESFGEEMADTLEEFGSYLQDSFIAEVDSFVDDFCELITETNLEVELSFWDDIEDLAEDFEFTEVTTETPTKDKYTACIGCCNYHGQAYNGQILVCAMHPYGVEDDDCQDWEGFENNERS